MFGFRTRAKIVEANRLLLLQQGIHLKKIETLTIEKRDMQRTIERLNNVVTNSRRRLIEAGLIDEPSKPLPEFMRRKPLDQQEKPPASVISMPSRHVVEPMDLGMSVPLSAMLARTDSAAEDRPRETIVAGGGGDFGGGGATGSWDSGSSDSSSPTSSD